jgi:RNA polymerase sigma factor for flagellar operon FliA
MQQQQLYPQVSPMVKVDFISHPEKHSAVERQDILSLLAQQIAQLPTVTKKVLAMYYYENMRLPEIAAGLGLNESKTWQTHHQAVASLRTLVTHLN